jgi:hypothetical protein
MDKKISYPRFVYKLNKNKLQIIYSSGENNLKFYK